MKKVDYLIFFGVLITSFWFWKVITTSLLLTLILVALSNVIYIMNIKNGGKKLITFAVVLPLFAFFISLSQNIDSNILLETGVEKDIQIKRYRYLAADLGKVYRNRLGVFWHKEIELPVRKYQSNLFQIMDLNSYFFASHPRERGGVEEFEKFSPFLLPFFVAGIAIFIFKNKFNFLFAIGMAVASAFVRPNYPLGPVLIFPVLLVSISLGIRYFFKKI